MIPGKERQPIHVGKEVQKAKIDPVAVVVEKVSSTIDAFGKVYSSLDTLTPRISRGRVRRRAK